MVRIWTLEHDHYDGWQVYCSAEPNAILSRDSHHQFIDIESVRGLVEALKLAIEYLEPRVGHKIGSRGATVILPSLKDTLANLPEELK